MNIPKLNLPALTGDEDRCPSCEESWIGDPIPTNILHHYNSAESMAEGKPRNTHWRKVIGVEVFGVYDGIHHWMCPKCKTQFARKGVSG